MGEQSTFLVYAENAITYLPTECTQFCSANYSTVVMDGNIFLLYLESRTINFPYYHYNTFRFHLFMSIYSFTIFFLDFATLHYR